MSRKRKAKPARNTRRNTKANKRLSANLLKKLFIGFCFLSIFAVPVYAYMKQVETEHDLSVIGQGLPTVVQVHDPNCSLCRELKGNLASVKAPYEGQIHFKSANRFTEKGARFANQQRVQHVTLLFFDGAGRRVSVLQGVQPENIIEYELDRLIELSGG